MQGQRHRVINHGYAMMHHPMPMPFGQGQRVIDHRTNLLTNLFAKRSFALVLVRHRVMHQGIALIDHCKAMMQEDLFVNKQNI